LDGCEKTVAAVAGQIEKFYLPFHGNTKRHVQPINARHVLK